MHLIGMYFSSSRLDSALSPKSTNIIDFINKDVNLNFYIVNIHFRDTRTIVIKK